MSTTCQFASQRLRLRLATEPEAKRKIIGETFIRVFEEVARDHSDARFLVQGTLYPDIVESGGGDKEKVHGKDRDPKGPGGMFRVTVNGELAVMVPVRGTTIKVNWE